MNIEEMLDKAMRKGAAGELDGVADIREQATMAIMDLIPDDEFEAIVHAVAADRTLQVFFATVLAKITASITLTSLADGDMSDALHEASNAFMGYTATLYSLGKQGYLGELETGSTAEED